MKKFLSVLLLTSVIFSSAAFSSCGKKPDNTATSDKSGETEEKGSAVSQNDDDKIDLAKMSSTVTYSYVCGILNSPDEYLGKTIKMSGVCGYFKDDSTDTVYYSCNISDTTACCSIGLEFLLQGKDYDEYPNPGDEITVEGIFETYYEGESRYGRLKDAKIVK